MICPKCGHDTVRPKRGLTPKQAHVLWIIKEYIEANEFSPSISDLATTVGTVPSNIHRMLIALERRGHITRDYGAARSITVL